MSGLSTVNAELSVDGVLMYWVIKIYSHHSHKHSVRLKIL